MPVCCLRCPEAVIGLSLSPAGCPLSYERTMTSTTESHSPILSKNDEFSLPTEFIHRKPTMAASMTSFDLHRKWACPWAVNDVTLFTNMPAVLTAHHARRVMQRTCRYVVCLSVRPFVRLSVRCDVLVIIKLGYLKS